MYKYFYYTTTTTTTTTEVARVTRDSETTFKVKRSNVNLQGRGHIVGPSAQLVTIKLYIIINGILAYKSVIARQAYQQSETET